MRCFCFLPMAAAILLNACAPEADRAAEYRARKTEECFAALREDPTGNALDADRFCGCVLDRQMDGKAPAELESFVPTEEQTREWGEQCGVASLRAQPAAPAPPPEPVKDAPRNR